MWDKKGISLEILVSSSLSLLHGSFFFFLCSRFWIDVWGMGMVQYRVDHAAICWVTGNLRFGLTVGMK